MQFLDLSTHHAELETEILSELQKILRAGDFINGSAVKSFEKSFAEHHHVAHALGMNSGTDALLLGLKALGVGPGDEVITTGFTFFATAEAIAHLGAKPVFIDIDPVSLNINPALIKAAITPRTKAILPVHIFGQPALMDQIMAIAQEHKLAVVEDACQAVGATFKGKKVGSFGDVGCFSFFPSKNLGCCGDGGMATTQRADIAAQMSLLKSHGSSPTDKYCNIALGYNSRLDTFQAAILSLKLKKIDSYCSARNEVAERYTQALKNVGDCVCPTVTANTTHVFHQYTIRSKHRDALKEFLAARGIPTMIYYRIPLHLQPALQYLGLREGALPETEKACKEVISLPIYPELSREDQQTIIGAISDFFSQQ